jgi:hypothetical protein
LFPLFLSLPLHPTDPKYFQQSHSLSQYSELIVLFSRLIFPGNRTEAINPIYSDTWLWAKLLNPSVQLLVESLWTDPKEMTLTITEIICS